jgi:hypothetical protein
MFLQLKIPFVKALFVHSILLKECKSYGVSLTLPKFQSIFKIILFLVRNKKDTPYKSYVCGICRGLEHRILNIVTLSIEHLRVLKQ